MKKVLAFVLAAIMVCTMAFAATTWTKVDNGTTTIGSTPTPPSVVNGDLVYPGQKISMKLINDKADATLTNLTGKTVYVCQTNDTFDLAAGKNVVKVTFAKGADLVASQGWDKADNGYAWVIKTKENLNKVYKDTEIEISKVEFAAYGHQTSDKYVTLFDGSKDGGNMKFFYGYLGSTTVAGDPYKLYIDANGDFGEAANDTSPVTTKVGYDELAVKMNTVIKTIKDKDADPTYDLDLAAGCVIKEKDSKITATMLSGNIYTVKDKFLDTDAQRALDNNVTNNRAKVMVEYNGLTLNTSATIKVTEAKDTYKAYAVDADGNVSLLSSKIDNGVLSFSLKNIDAFVVVDGTLTATGATGAAAATSTNPNTGANDVIGVAAALAVVALVSGAAISLKK